MAKYGRVDDRKVKAEEIQPTVDELIEADVVVRLGHGVYGVAGNVTLGNSQTFNELLQAVAFGGLFSFDVGFSVNPTGTIGSYFGIALVNAALDGYVPGTAGDIVGIAILPGMPDAMSANGDFASIAEVPEPATPALLAFGAIGLVTPACVAARDSAARCDRSAGSSPWYAGRATARCQTRISPEVCPVCRPDDIWTAFFWFFTD